MKKTSPRADFSREKNVRSKGVQNTNELVGSSESKRIRQAAFKALSYSKEKCFQTDKYKTRNSSWTPVVNPYCNNELYQGRVDLICHWFSMWTDAQRKNFLKTILKRSTKLQIKFVKELFFSAPLPILKADFTTLLPRFISMYIFSFLDPRSLSRAAQVSWHWKFISEQDDIWMLKCLRFGWFLPYKPGSREYGSWKHHYITCTSTLDKEDPSLSRRDEVYATLGPEEILAEKNRKNASQIKKRDETRRLVYFKNDTRRPPWIDPDTKPKDLETARKAMFSDYNPNHPTSFTEQRAERLGLTSKGHQRALTAPTRKGAWERRTSTRKRSASAGGTKEHSEVDWTEGKEPVSSSAQLTLSEALAMESIESQEKADESLSKNMPSSIVRRKDLTVGFHPSFRDSTLDSSTIIKDNRWDSYPAVIFLSSEVPACEVLLDAVLLSAIAIPYQYEGSTLESLAEKLRLALNGRLASSIGFFALGEAGRIRLTQDHLVSDKNLQDPDMKDFWETIATSIIPRLRGGHMDFFIPLTETESGMDLLVQLGLLTDIQISCPTCTTGLFSQVTGEWLYNVKNIAPSLLYFDTKKLGAWASMTDYLEIVTRSQISDITDRQRLLIKECSQTVRDELLPFFTEQRQIVALKTIGEVVSRSLGLQYIDHLTGVARIIVRATVKLREETTDYRKEDLLNCLIESLQAERDGKTTTKKVRRRKSTEISDDSDNDSGSEPEKREDTFISTATEFGSGSLVFNESGEKRKIIAQEILRTEVQYMEELGIVQKVFRGPLEAAFSSNRAILSLPNIKALFGDMETLLNISNLMVDEISARLEKNTWNSQQCLGDIFVQFANQSRAYTNFLNNYPLTLNTLQRCKEQNPQFRAFLARHERQTETKMMSFSELLLLPEQRLKSYVDMLQRFLRHTPLDHVDRKNVTDAIARIQDMYNMFKQYEERLNRDKHLRQWQKTIVNCPVLSEKGRYLICTENFALLSYPAIGKDVKPEYRLYLQCGDIGLFLFNDSLVVAVLTYRDVPFKRLVQRYYKFQACVSLKQLKVQNVADTKYLKNAFFLLSSTRTWICKASYWEQKLRFLSVIEKAIAGAL